MNIRIQTYGTCNTILADFTASDRFHADSTTAYDALEKGFDELMGLCDAVLDKFMVARDGFNATKNI